MRGLAAFLQRHSRIALDTSIFLYQLELNERYAALAGAVFDWIEQPRHFAVTSTITMTELLVHPYRDDDETRVNVFYGLLTTYPNLEWIPADLEIADRAARLRARHGLRAPDALQAATALCSAATGYVSNDSVFKRVAGFETILFDEMLQ